MEIVIANGAIYIDMLEKAKKRLSNPEFFQRVMETKKMISDNRGVFIYPHESGKKLLYYTIHFREESDKLIIW